MTYHNTFFYFHPKVIEGLIPEEINRRCQGFLNHCNFIINKTISRQMVYKGYNITETAPMSNSYFDLPLDFDIWIYTPYTPEFSRDASMSADMSGVGVLFQKWNKLYPPESNEYDYIYRQVGSIVHEFGHLFLMPGELYDLAVVEDLSKTEPNLSIDIRTSRQSINEAPFWKDHLDCYYDPMSNFQGMEKSRFGKVHSAIINGRYRAPKYNPPFPNLEKINIKTVPGTQVVVWRSDNSAQEAKIIASGFSNNEGIFTFNWGTTHWTQLSSEPDRLRFIKVYKDGKATGKIIDVIDLFETSVIKQQNIHTTEISFDDAIGGVVNPPITNPDNPEDKNNSQDEITNIQPIIDKINIVLSQIKDVSSSISLTQKKLDGIDEKIIELEKQLNNISITTGVTNNLLRYLNSIIHEAKSFIQKISEYK